MTSIKLLDTVIILSLLLAIIFLIWYLVGDSPTFNQLLTSAMAALYLMMYGLNREVGEIKKDMKTLENGIETSRQENKTAFEELRKQLSTGVA